MSDNHGYAEIIARVEQVRADRGLTKGAFVAALGMSQQTYNNFTGAQRSKPSIGLILGVAHAYGVSYDWLLDGRGLMYREAQERLLQGPDPGSEQQARALATLNEMAETARLVADRADRLFHILAGSGGDVLDAPTGQEDGRAPVEPLHAKAR